MTSIAFQALPPVSSPESYVQAVNAIPMLTAERELELGRRLKETGDVTAAKYNAADDASLRRHERRHRAGPHGPGVVDAPALELPHLTREDPQHLRLHRGGIRRRQDVAGTPADDVLAPPAEAGDPGAGHQLIAQVLAEDHQRRVGEGVGERPEDLVLRGRRFGIRPKHRHGYVLAVVRHA